MLDANILFLACQNNNIDLIKECIDNGCNVNERNIFDGQTPLIKLIMRGNISGNIDISSIEYLVQHGADVNIVDYDGKNALSYAYEDSVNEYLQKLQTAKDSEINSSDNEVEFESKLNFQNNENITSTTPEIVNAFDENGFTPLTWSIWYQKFDRVNYYILAGADVNLRNPDGKTPLMIACYKFKINIVKLLLNNGANFNELDNFGNSPMTYLMSNSYYSSEICEDDIRYLFRAGADINLCGRNAKTLLIWCVINFNLDFLKNFKNFFSPIYNSININRCDNVGNSALGYLTFHNKPNINLNLFKEVVNVDFCGKKGRTPLAWAIINNNWKMFEWLIERNAKINYIDFYGNTPLKYARGYNRYNMISDLVRNGAIDPDIHPLVVAMKSNDFENVQALLKNDLSSIVTELEKTPLCLAVKKKMDFVKVLIQNGADCCHKDKNGYTPLIYAIHNKDIEIIKYLLENGAKSTIHSAFNEALELENVEIIKLLIENGAKVNKIYGEAGSPLLQAIDMKNEEILKLLLASGASPNSNENPSPLINAINLRYFTFVKCLIENGANVDEDSDETPLQRACKLGEFDLIKLLVENKAALNPNKFPSPLRIVVNLNKLQLCRYLIENGANVCEICKDEKSLLQLAVEKNNMELVKLLVEKNCEILKIKNQYPSPLRNAITLNNSLSLINYFIEQGVDVNETDENNKESLLQLAIGKPNFSLVVSLLQHGANIDDGDNRDALEEFSEADLDFKEFFTDFIETCNVDDGTRHLSNKEEDPQK